MTDRNDTPTGTSAADHLTDAELERIARAGLPDRETLEQRLRNAQSQLIDVRSLLRVAAAVLTTDSILNVDDGDVALVIEVAGQRLEAVDDMIDPVSMLKAAEAEVSHE